MFVDAPQTEEFATIATLCWSKLGIRREKKKNIKCPKNKWEESHLIHVPPNDEFLRTHGKSAWCILLFL